VQWLHCGVDVWIIRVQFPEEADVYFFYAGSIPDLKFPNFLSNVQRGLFSWI
jgi:hypothetical protein